MTNIDKKKPWKRSKKTTELVEKIRKIITQELGYKEERGIVPLADKISVICATDNEDETVNVMLDKKTLEVVGAYDLKYNYYKGNLRRIFRTVRS